MKNSGSGRNSLGACLRSPEIPTTVSHLPGRGGSAAAPGIRRRRLRIHAEPLAERRLTRPHARREVAGHDDRILAVEAVAIVEMPPRQDRHIEQSQIAGRNGHAQGAGPGPGSASGSPSR